MMQESYDIRSYDGGDPDIAERIQASLAAFNSQSVGPSERRDPLISVHGDNGALIGGLNGFTAWGWLFVETSWLAAECRVQSAEDTDLEKCFSKRPN